MPLGNALGRLYIINIYTPICILFALIKNLLNPLGTNTLRLSYFLSVFKTFEGLCRSKETQSWLEILISRATNALRITIYCGMREVETLPE